MRSILIVLHTYLESCKLSPDSIRQRFEYFDEDPIYSKFGTAGVWRAIRSCSYPAAHVNVQELREIATEAKRCCRSCLSPVRHLNMTDSGVRLGAWGKFRSFSFKLNASEQGDDDHTNIPYCLSYA